jgi:hypothetical protein
MINRRVPVRISRFIRWLRKPSSFAARLTVAFFLILGGVFSFLPMLGIWMLPLGLLFIAQDVPLLQKPLWQRRGRRFDRNFALDLLLSADIPVWVGSDQSHRRRAIG